MSRVRDIANLFSGNTDAATDAEVASAISSHSSASDPHGDRAAATTAISSHSSASDPHGDRAAATSAISTHASASNGHFSRGNTASRPGSPSLGDLYFDTTLDTLIQYASTGWTQIAPTPNPPTSVTATQTSSTSASISFTAPASGPTVSSYIVSSSPGNLTATGSSSPITVNGLSGGVTYTFVVYSVGANGVGSASSASSPITIAFPTVSGGTLSSDSTYYYRTFTSNGTLSVSTGSLNMQVLLVAGGGSGAGTTAGNCGGGGAGGVLYHSAKSVSPGNYSVSIGAGASAATASTVNGNTGNNSTFDTMTAYGGGYGSYYTNGAGGNGGSGGGAGYSGYAGGTATQNINGGATTAYGNAGGSNVTGGTEGAGGGGAGGAGIQGTSALLGQGGPGTNAFSEWATATSTGTSGYYAGGGGGAPMSNATDLGRVSYTQAGRVNTGGGGGGRGGVGGSGIVIVRYLKSSVGG